MNAPLDMATPVAPAEAANWTEQNRRWLVAQFARLRQSLAADPATETPGQAIADTGDISPPPALLQLAAAFDLSPFERDVLLLVAGVELDRELRALVLRRQGGLSARPSFALALDCLEAAHWDALSPDGPLRRWLLLTPEAALSPAHSPLGIDEPILHFIAGLRGNDPHLAGIARYVPAIADGFDSELVARIAQALTQSRHATIVTLAAAPHDASKLRDTALSVAVAVTRPVLWIDAAALPPTGTELAHVARRLDRQVALHDALPTILIDGPPAERAAAALAGRLESTLLWLGPSGHGLAALPHRPRVLRFEVPAPGSQDRCRALLARWPSKDAHDDSIRDALTQAAAQFHVGSAAMDDIVQRLQGVTPEHRSAEVWPAVREAARSGLDALAHRIPSRATFEDLVLPPAQLVALRDIARHLRHRERVHGDWGFGARNGSGLGLVALFTGESGTGKTLAAEAIANAASLDLYRVDLASLVSKYIGETEKNLGQLFDAAETSGAVLLFDEADALFGKRSEVRDSHDRYANIEVAYLLQRIETYRGLAILTTNMRSALDRAFLRRIRFIVSFPFPDAEARERIWRNQFSPTVPLGAVDFASLARLNLPGGNIRSVALNAAFKAADSGSAIDQPILIAAARAEFAKLERSFNEPAMGRGA